MRRTTGGALVTGLLVTGLLTGCGAEVTAGGLQRSLGPVVARRYLLQQQETTPGAGPDRVHAGATCRRTMSSTPTRGAGQDWSCVVVLTAPGLTPAGATFAVVARPDGCYVAAGPAGTVGPAVLHTADGRSVTNPLAAFDGCYDLD